MNSIQLAAKFAPILDELYKRESLTAFLDAKSKPVDFGGVNEVKIFKITTYGLGNYDRSYGYPHGAVKGVWETIQLTIDRARAMHVDRMDNEESLGQAFGRLASEFMRIDVVPEIDAFRFAKWASWTGVQAATPATLATAAETLAAIDVASNALDDEEVPSEGRLLFIRSTHHRLLNAAITRTLSNDRTAERRLKVLDDMKIIPVPKSRLVTKIDLAEGDESETGGWVKSATGKDINFILMHPSCRDQATKLANMKVFDPDTNQSADAWLLQYRHYHDVWVYDNKVKGIYVHHVA